MRRLVLVVLVVALLQAGLFGAPAANADTALPSCGGGTTTNCVVSVTRNGMALEETDPYVLSATMLSEGTYQYHFSVTREEPPIYSLDSSDVWQVVLNTGSTFPGESFIRGRDVEVVRGGNATDGYTIGFTLHPVRMAYGTCDSTGSCGDETTVADTLATGYLEVWIDDLSYITDPDDRAAMRGFDFATNADWASSPPLLNYETRAVIIDVGNAHLESPGVPFVGSAELNLPFPMLRRLYLVDDPATLTAGAFEVTTGSEDTTTTVTVGSSSVRVVIENITFSKRRLKVQGDTRPAAPRDVSAVRKSDGRGVIKFKDALARGSKVRGYLGVCSGGGHKITTTASDSPLRITGLKPGRGYDCVLRAKSHAGLGRRASVHLPGGPS